MSLATSIHLLNHVIMPLSIVQMWWSIKHYWISSHQTYYHDSYKWGDFKSSTIKQDKYSFTMAHLFMFTDGAAIKHPKFNGVEMYIRRLIGSSYSIYRCIIKRLSVVIIVTAFPTSRNNISLLLTFMGIFTENYTY